MKHHYPDCQGGPSCECDEREETEIVNLTTVGQLIDELRWARDCYGSQAKVAISGFDECEISVVSNEQRDEYPEADILLES